MPSRLRHRTDAIELTTITPSADSAHSNMSIDALVALANTIRARETIRFDYAPRIPSLKDNGSLPPRRVEPHHNVTTQGRWYLLALDLDRVDWRLFSATRITPRTPNGPRFTPRKVPGGDVNEFVFARFKGSATNEWPYYGAVILHLPASAVLPFAGGGNVQLLGPNRCSLEVGSWSWGSLAASFGRFEAPMKRSEPS